MGIYTVHYNKQSQLEVMFAPKVHWQKLLPQQPVFDTAPRSWRRTDTNYEISPPWQDYLFKDNWVIHWTSSVLKIMSLVPQKQVRPDWARPWVHLTTVLLSCSGQTHLRKNEVRLSIHSISPNALNSICYLQLRGYFVSFHWGYNRPLP